MKWILIVVGVIAGLITLMAIIGSLMPKGHTASRSTVINKPPEVLWQTMTGCTAFPLVWPQTGLLGYLNRQWTN